MSHYSNKPVKSLLYMAMFAGSTLLSPAVLAEEDSSVLEEVFVTGTLIRGTPIDTESPVTIIDRGALQKQGAPSIVDIVRRLSSSSGVDGETNQFGSNASEGVASVNLRGLGAARTLVLLNSKRQTPVAARLGGGRFVDVNNFPTQAIERVEVLKEGAAATYGSDAIGGVVNFITRKNFEGLEVSVGYQDIDDADGSEEFGAIWGHDFGNFHVVSSIGYQKRNELNLKDRDYATRPFSENPEGGFSSVGNPGTFFHPATVATLAQFGVPLNASLNTPGLVGTPAEAFAGLPSGVVDPNCNQLGGVTFGTICRFRFTDFDNAIEEQENLQWFTEVNGEFGGAIGFHAEFLYSTIDVDAYATSPSYPAQSLFGDIQNVPADHPALVDFATRHPEFQPFIDSGDGATFFGRIVGVGAAGPREAERSYDTYRFAASLDGEFQNGNLWDAGFTYSQSEGVIEGADAQIGRTKLAFNGFGGNDCAAGIDTAGNIVANGAVAGQAGCLYYNPFSTAIQTSQAADTFGVVNPEFDPALANSAEILSYLDEVATTDVESSLLVLDASVQGLIFEGEAAWVAGYQYRRTDFKQDVDQLIDLDINPCSFPGQTVCDSETGLRSFLSGGRNSDDDADVHAFFLETDLHISDDLDVQLAVRYEDYGSSDTLDPKVAVRWGINEWLTVRASAQTTFRGPDIDQLSPDAVTALAFIAPTLAFKAVDIVGSPDLDPEEAFTYNIGLVMTPTDELRVTLDYWFYDFDNPIAPESFTELVAAYAGGDGDDATAAQLAKRAAVQDQIFCTGSGNDGACAASGIERVQTLIINGPKTETSGIDLFAEYTMDMGPGLLSFGVDASYTLEYKVDAFIKNGTEVSSAYEGAGSLNQNRGTRPLPDYKGKIFGEYSWDRHNVLLYVNHTSSYEDDRGFGDIDSQTTVDFHYQVSLLEDDKATFTFSAINLTDEEPPEVRVELGYDAYTHNAFGTILKAGLTYRM